MKKIRPNGGEKKEMKVRIYIAPTLNALTDHLKNLVRGRKVLVFCEDRLTLEAERAAASAQGAVFDVRVTTFARFLDDGTPRKVLTKQGSVLVVGGIASHLAGELKCFGKNPSGCAAGLYETIAQLRAALVTPEMLEEARAEADKLLAEKLGDIALVYREYLAFLDKGYLDESGVLALLPAAIGRQKLKGAHICFAGFSSFTRQAAEGILAACRSGAEVSAVLIGGEESVYTNEAVLAFEKYVRRAGAECEKIYLPSDLIPEAEALRRTLFDPAYPIPKETGRVHIFEASDPEDELRFIAAAMRAEVYRGARWKDISLYLSDVAGYGVSLQKIFAEYRIPYYADVKKSVAKHPLCRFVLGWFSMLSEGFDPADADAFIGNPFFGGERKNRDTYRNYLLQFANFRGGCKRAVKEIAQESKGAERQQAEAEREVLCAERERLLSAFEGASASMTGGEYCRLVRRLLDKFSCEETQEKLAAALEEQGLLAESSYFSRGLESILRVLDEAEELAGDTKMPAEEFASVLAQALDALEISLIPQYLDAVFVGDISESRRPASKIVFAAGLTDDVPMYGADTALISDRDIDRLRTLQVEITPKIREINARTRENVALAICGFTERLYLSYPLSEGGEERKRSEVIGEVCALFQRQDKKPLAPINRAVLSRGGREGHAAYVRYLADTASEYIPAVRELLQRADEFRRGKGDFAEHTGIYAALKERGAAPDPLLFPAEPAAPFSAEAAQVLLRGRAQVAPTLVEGYFECPYRNFAQRGLRLSEREEMSVRPADTGDFMHELLRRVAEKAGELPDRDACAEFTDGQIRELLAKPPYSYLADTPTGGYSAESLRREAMEICGNMYASLADSEFRVYAAEKSFGYNDSLFAGIPLTDGIALAGKIDRVDRGGEYTRVIDYKTGVFDAKPEPYYTGRKLQLELYLSAASRGSKPAGAYYFPAKVSFRDKAEDAAFRMQGYTLESDEVVRMSDKTVEQGKKSRYIDAYFGKKGKKMLSEADFDAFLYYSVLAAQQCAKETEAGCIAVSPYEGACKYCPYGSVCGFECGGAARTESKVTQEEIIRIVRRRRGEI